MTCPSPDTAAAANYMSDRATTQALMSRHGCPAGCAKWYLPLTVTLAATVGATGTSENEPQRPFRGVRVFIPASVASDVVVTDFKVANQSQFVADGRVSGELFVPDAVDGMVCFQATWSTNKYALQLENLTAVALTINAALLGYVQI